MCGVELNGVGFNHTSVIPGARSASRDPEQTASWRPLGPGSPFGRPG